MTTVAGLLCAVVMTATAERERLVVLEVTAGDEGTKRAARMVEEQLLTELGRAGTFEVTGQSELSAVLGLERQRQLLGCAESSCFAEIGGALGARWLVMGSLGRFGSKLRLDLKLIDARQGKAAAREGKVLESDDELFPAVSQFVGTLEEASSGSLSRTPAPRSTAAGARSSSPSSPGSSRWGTSRPAAATNSSYRTQRATVSSSSASGTACSKVRAPAW